MLSPGSLYCNLGNFGWLPWGLDPGIWGWGWGTSMISGSYGLNMCSSQFICWSPECDGIWRWCLWEVSRSWGGTLMNGISALIRRTGDSLFPQSPLSLCHVRTHQEGSQLQTKDRALPKSPTMLAPQSLTSASRTVRNQCLLFKPSSLWYFCYSSLNWLRRW